MSLDLHRQINPVYKVRRWHRARSIWKQLALRLSLPVSIARMAVNLEVWLLLPIPYSPLKISSQRSLKALDVPAEASLDNLQSRQRSIHCTLPCNCNALLIMSSMFPEPSQSAVAELMSDPSNSNFCANSSDSVLSREKATLKS